MKSLFLQTIRYLGFIILSGVLIPVTLFAGDGKTYSDSIIHQDMTWSGTVIIKGVFVVGRSATLTIQPGTTILFHKIDSNNDNIGDAEIRVLGRIVAEGSKGKPIVFRSAEDKPAPMDWSYVLIFASAESNSLKYCVFRDAFTGLQVHFSTASVSDSIFINNNEGLRFGRAKLVIKHNLVKENNIGIRFTRMEGPVELTGNTVTNNRIGVFLVPSSQQIIDFFEPGRTGRPWNEGHLVITNNNIYDNSDYNLNLGAKQIWDLAISGNWWGTVNKGIIRQTIFDKQRDDVLGNAIFEPIQMKKIENAGPR